MYRINNNTFSLQSFFSLLLLTMPSIRAPVLAARNRMLPRDVAENLSQKLDVGDWWVLYMLGRNMDPIIYRDIMIELSDRVGRRNHRIDEKTDSL